MLTPEPISNFSNMGLGPPTYDVDPALEAVVLDMPPQPRGKWPYGEGEEVPVEEVVFSGDAWHVRMEGEEPGSFWTADAASVDRWVYGDADAVAEALEHLEIAEDILDSASADVPGATADVKEAMRKLDEALGNEKKPGYARH